MDSRKGSTLTCLLAPESLLLSWPAEILSVTGIRLVMNQSLKYLVF